MTDNEKPYFIEKNKKGEDCVFLKDGDKVENVSKSFEDIIAMLDEADNEKEDKPINEELKKEIIGFLTKEFNLI